MARLELSRSQILGFRRHAGSLYQRLPARAKSLRQAAWAGLQDSSPRAALLSIHARLENTTSTSWEHKSLVQLWGPRFSDYVVAAQDIAVFSLGRLPEDSRRRARAHDIASRLHTFFDDRRMSHFRRKRLGKARTQGACMLAIAWLAGVGPEPTRRMNFARFEAHRD
jgi:hypothetical protein